MRILIILLLLPVFAMAQQRQVSGSVKNEAGKPIVHAAVTMRNSLEQVINYGMTNVQGQYSFAVSDTAKLDQSYLEVNMLGFKRVQQKFVENQFVYHFTLKESVIELQEVQIKSKPKITSSGDTLTYDVASFAREEDRNIGEVMSRMPGITVAENGEVYFNGKSITSLLTGGDDLMGGRYGLATKTITKDMIKSIEVIKNHQPIKVLKNRVFTENTVINLVLKDENSLRLSGQAMLGGGFPQQYDGALNTMILSGKFKMLNVLKANNSGLDFRDEFTQFGAASMLNNIGNTRPSALLSAGTAGNPDIPRRNYYLNNSGVLNLNNLVNRKNGNQLKANIQLFADRNTLNYESNVDNYLNGNTIHYRELQQAVRKPWLLNTSFTSMMNKNTYFLDNNFKFNVSSETKQSYMGLNNIAFNQQLKDRTYDISNDLNFIPLLKNKGVMEFRWYFNYFNAPQTLDVGAGLNNALLNNNVPYQAILQHTAIPTFFNHVYTSFRPDSKVISQRYLVGFFNERQRLNSDLNLVQNDNSVTSYTGDEGNELRWQRDRLYINADYGIKKAKWEAGLSIPLAWQSIRYSQEAYNLDQAKQQLLINPALRFKLFLSDEDYVSANYSYNTSVGNINGVYRGTILSNYRGLRANNTDLQEQYISGTGINFNFQRSIIMLFANAGISYNKVSANTILSSELSNNVQRTILLPFDNDQSVLSVSAGASKMIFALNTTFSVRSSWSKGKVNQLINSQSFLFNNESSMLSVGLESKFLDLTLSYMGTGNWNKNSSVDNAGNVYKSVRYDQNLNLGYSPFASFFVHLQGRHIYSAQPGIREINYFFMDSKMRYKLKKWKTDIEFDLTNIFNVKYYEIFSLNANQSSANRYEIRGLMGVLRATFTL